MYSRKLATGVKIERIDHLENLFTSKQQTSNQVQLKAQTYSKLFINQQHPIEKMASTTNTTANNNTTTKATPKSLPKFYKGLLYSTLSFINEYIEDEEQRKTLYSKLPLFEDVEKQIEYFNTNCDLKKVHNEVFKPLLKQHKKEIKEANKPVKEKKPRAPRKKKAPKTEEAEAEATETEAESSSTETEGASEAPKPVEKKEKKEKKTVEKKEKKIVEKKEKDTEKKGDSTSPPKLKKPRAPRKKKEATDSTVEERQEEEVNTPTPILKASEGSSSTETNEEELTYDKIEN